MTEQCIDCGDPATCSSVPVDGSVIHRCKRCYSRFMEDRYNVSVFNHGL